MKAKLFVSGKPLKAKDGKFIKWWEDNTKIKALDVYAWYDRIKICLDLEDGSRRCYEDTLGDKEDEDIYGKIEWGDHYLLNLKGKDKKPVLQYYGRRLPFIREVSFHFKKGDLPNFEISGMDKESF